MILVKLTQSPVRIYRRGDGGQTVRCGCVENKNWNKAKEKAAGLLMRNPDF